MSLDLICLKCPLFTCDEKSKQCLRMESLRAKWRADYRRKHPQREVKKQARPKYLRRGRPFKLPFVSEPPRDFKADLLAILTKLNEQREVGLTP